MTDQWPRFEVFKQDKVDGPIRNVGSVHAPDAELALLNARDVFARRPACVGLWVIPAEAIYARTAEELAGEPAVEPEVEGESIQYAVFSKRSQRQTMTHVDYDGQIAARSPEEALRLAVETYTDPLGIVWWVCPAHLIGRSEAGDVAGYEAATSKLFRMPNQYRTVFTMQKIKRGEGDGE